MNKLVNISCCVVLANMAVLSGCTINHYHASASNPAMVDNSLLVIPETNSAHSPTATKSNGFKSSDMKNSIISEPGDVLSMSTTGVDDDHSIEYMDSVGLEVESKVDAYLNCYHQQADGAIIKVFPNRYTKRYWVYASQQLSFPDEKYFKFVANSAGSSEGFICLVSEEDVLSKLPKVYQALTFQKLPFKNFDAVYALYEQSTGENLVAHVVSYIIR